MSTRPNGLTKSYAKEACAFDELDLEARSRLLKKIAS